MTRQAISRGTSANARDGDTLRDAAQKINQNFIEVYTKLGGDSATLSTNVGFTAAGIIFEGDSSNAHETTLGVTNPTKDNTITLPDSSGDVILTTAIQTLTNKTLTAPVISTISNTGVLTLPTSTDTLVGRATADTLTNKTLTSPTLSTPVINTGINDTNGAEIIRFTATASAVNDISITNAATTGSPIIAAVGDDTNINLDLAAKGTGAIRHTRKVAYSSETKTSSGAVSLLVPLTLFNSTGSLTMTMANGVVVGESKRFVNINTGAATVTPTSFGQGTSFTLSQNGAAECIWTGSNWHLFGDSDNFLTIT